MKSISFLEEKKWIMVLWYKKNYKNFSLDGLLFQWNMWWKKDFISVDDDGFDQIFEWIKLKIKLPKEEIVQERKKVADNRRMPKWLEKLADEKGYCVKKASTGRYPLRVSGYAVFAHPKCKRRNAIIGDKFDLTAEEVKRFLESEGK